MGNKATRHKLPKADLSHKRFLQCNVGFSALFTWIFNRALIIGDEDDEYHCYDYISDNMMMRMVMFECTTVQLIVISYVTDW